MKSKKQIRASGQALIEYLLIFSFMTFIALGLVRGIGKMLTNSIGTIGYELTEQLTVGVCAKMCFYNSFKNQER